MNTMFSSVFNSIDPSFSPLPYPLFFFPSRQHKEALRTLLQGLKTRSGLLILTGEQGLGKTTVCRLLLDRLGHHIKQAFIFHASPTRDALIQNISDDFGLPTTGNATQDRDDGLNPFLFCNRLDGSDTIVIIDDTSIFSSDYLDVMGTFFQPESQPEPLMLIVFVGGEAISHFQLAG